MTAQERLADEVTQLVRALQEETDPDAVLQRVVDAAVVEVPGADWAGVTVLARDGARTPARSADDVQLGGLLAAHAGIVVVAKRTEAQLRTALDSRDVIGQAKGRLMERYGLTAEQAFDRLIAGSQAANMKLREVAAKVADPGGLELPGSRTGSLGG